MQNLDIKLTGYAHKKRQIDMIATLKLNYKTKHIFTTVTKNIYLTSFTCKQRQVNDKICKKDEGVWFF